MKRFSKITLSVAAVSALTTAMAISASAMTANYSNGTVTLADITATGASQTLLIVGADGTTAAKDVTVTSDNASTVVKQIDQKDDGSTFETSATQVAIPVGTLADGTYEVRVGGDGTIQTATFNVGGTEVKTKDVLVGDIDLGGTILGSDLTNLKRGIAGKTTGTGSYNKVLTKADGSGTVIVGDIDLGGTILGSDLTNLKRGIAGKTTGTGSYNTTVTVIDQ